MSNQPQPQPDSVALSFGRDEWELIVTLPRRVLIAALAAAPAEGRHAVDGIAGIAAIASGLASPSPLVREVVASIYSENHHYPDDMSGDGEQGTVQTLAACRYAAEVVANRCGVADMSAYTDWLHHIAAVVTGVAQGATAPGSRRQVGLADSRFLYALGGVLRP